MTSLEVYNILRNSGKFPNLIFGETNSNVRYSSFAEIKYIINESEYIISVTDDYKFSFFNCHPFSDIKELEFTIINDFCVEKKIISSFKTFLKKIIKLDIYIQKREIDKIGIKDTINNYIKKTYNHYDDLKYNDFSVRGFHSDYITIQFSSKNSILRINSKKTYNDKLFDTSLEHYSRYNISVFLNNNNSNILLQLYYDGESKKLALISKIETNKTFSNDITKIIRKEKLIKLMTDD